MDTKYKIIIIIFIAIILLYVGHFLINYMTKSKINETFMSEDDVEHYDEPPIKNEPIKQSETQSETQYDLRVLILDDIEKLNIPVKESKGKLMETMFNENMINKIKSLNNADRFMFIKDQYTILSNSFSSETPITVIKKEQFDTISDVITNKISDITNKIKSTTSETTDNKDINNNMLLTKTNNALMHLSNVQTELNDIKGALSLTPKIINPIINKSKFTEPLLPNTSDSIIEGFENIKGYASLF